MSRTSFPAIERARRAHFWFAVGYVVGLVISEMLTRAMGPLV